MKTLFEKLKPEVAELLRLETERYPTTARDLIDELQSKYFWTEITVKNAYFLVRLDLNKSFNIYQLTECFENGN